MGEQCGGGDTMRSSEQGYKKTQTSGFLGTLTLHSQAILEPTLYPEAVQRPKLTIGGHVDT